MSLDRQGERRRSLAGGKWHRYYVEMSERSPARRISVPGLSNLKATSVTYFTRGEVDVDT